MLEPVSTAKGLMWLDQSALYAFARSSSAISAEAQTVSVAASDLLANSERSQFLFGGKMTAITQLNGIARDCQIEGWDGYGAMPIEVAAVRQAKNFVHILPDDLPQPELAPEPDGSISLDWIDSRNRLLSLSIGLSDRISYAWLDGTDKGHGVVRFDGTRVPPRLLSEIRRIILDGNIAFRAA